MKIKINPKYEEMRSFIERIPDVFEKEGRVIQAETENRIIVR